MLRGVEGFGARSRVRMAKILELSTDLPIIVEIVDRAEAFLPVIDGAIADGLATVEKVQIKFYRSGPACRNAASESEYQVVPCTVVVSNRA